MILEGRVWKYDNNVDTDVIIPARFLNTSDAEELKKHCMEDIDLSFSAEVKPGDIIVAGSNFGCGSSREHAPIAIKASGVSCIIAQSFARIFFRNAVNIGLPVLQVEETEKFKKGDRLKVDIEEGVIENLDSGEKSYAAQPPCFLKEIYECDGLVNYIIKQGKMAK